VRWSRSWRVGRGQSTLLHILGTLDLPTTGQLLFRRQERRAAVAAGLADFRNRSIGFVFQFHTLARVHRARERDDAALIQRIRPARGQPARHRDPHPRRSSPTDSTHKPGELSGGEQQRVALRERWSCDGAPARRRAPGNLDAKTGDRDPRVVLRAEPRTRYHDDDRHAQPELAARMPRRLTMVGGTLVEVTPHDRQPCPCAAADSPRRCCRGPPRCAAAGGRTVKRAAAPSSASSSAANRKVRGDAMRVNLVSKSAQELDQDKVRDDVRALWKMGFFEAVRVEGTQTETSGVVLTYVVRGEAVHPQDLVQGSHELGLDKLNEVNDLNARLHPRRHQGEEERREGCASCTCPRATTWPRSLPGAPGSTSRRSTSGSSSTEQSKVEIRRISFVATTASASPSCASVMGTPRSAFSAS